MPTNEALYDEAIELQQRGDVTAAVGKLDELLKQDATYALAHAALSVFYSKLDDYEKAIEHANKVCEMEPEGCLEHEARDVPRRADLHGDLARIEVLVGNDPIVGVLAGGVRSVVALLVGREWLRDVEDRR